MFFQLNEHRDLSSLILFFLSATRSAGIEQKYYVSDSHGSAAAFRYLCAAAARGDYAELEQLAAGQLSRLALQDSPVSPGLPPKTMPFLTISHILLSFLAQGTPGS
jgi:hypothetical protein